VVTKQKPTNGKRSSRVNQTLRSKSENFLIISFFNFLGKGVFDMRRKQSFRFLWAGQTLANFGDVFYIVALITLVYKATGVATFAALIPFCVCGAQLISGLIAPLVLVKQPLRLLLWGCQAAKTGLLVLLTLYVTEMEAAVGVVLLFVVLISFLDGWMNPTRNAMVPRLVEADGLVRANSLLASTDQTLQLVGWAAGGLLVAAVGGGAVLMGTCALSLVAAVMLLGIREEATASSRMDEVAAADATNGASHALHEATDDEKSAPSGRQVLLEGWAAIWQTPVLRAVTVMDVLEGLASGVWIGALQLVYVEQILGQGEQWWGFINASNLLGMILGGMLAFRFAARINRRLGGSLFVGALVSGLFTLGFALTSTPWVALLVSLLLGPALQLRDLAQRTLFQQAVPAARLPQVFSAQGTLGVATFLLAVVLMGWLADSFGIRAAYVCGAGLSLLSAAVAVWQRRVLFLQK
jgi:MFS family permease